MPTASSIQIRRSASRIAPQINRRYSNFFTNLNTSSQTRPVPNRSTPAMMKSLIDQFTSSVNCMATNGINSRIATVDKMAKSRMFGVIMELIFVVFKLLCISKLNKSTLHFKVISKKIFPQ